MEREAMSLASIKPEAVLTSGGALPARQVTHSAGMASGGEDTFQKVSSSVRNALAIASELA